MKKVNLFYLTSFLLISTLYGCQSDPSGRKSNDGFLFVVLIITLLICGIPIFLQYRKRKKMQLIAPEKFGKKETHIVKRDAIIGCVFGIVLVIISQTFDALKYHRPKSDEEVTYYIVLFLGILFISVGGGYYANSVSKEKKEK